MFSIQFCVCFHMILNISYCHFSSNIYENCTKKNNFVPKNGYEARITEKNDTTEANDGKNVADTSAEIYTKGVEVITKINRVTEEMNNANVDEGTEKLKVKEKGSLLDMGVTPFDLNITENKKTNIFFNFSEERAGHKNHSEVVKDIGGLTDTKDAIVEKLSTKIINESLTKTVNKNDENNDTDKNVQKYDLIIKDKNYDLRKNVKNVTMTSNMTNFVEGNSTNKNVQKNDLPKNENKDLYVTNDKNQTMPENKVNIFESHNTDQNVLNNDSPKKENNDLHKNVKSKTITEDVNITLQNYSTEQNVLKYDLLKTEYNGFYKDVQNEGITENVIIFSQDNCTDQNVLKTDLPKNENNDLYKNDNNQTITENITSFFENSTDVQKYDLRRKEINDLHKDVQTENVTITENVVKLFESKSTDQNVEEYDMHKNVKNYTSSENVTTFLKINNTDKNNKEYDLPKNESNDIHKNIQKYDSPKNVQKRDIGVPENVSNDKMAKVFQKNDATKYHKFNSNDKYETNDMGKNIRNDITVNKLKHHNKHVHNTNEDKFINYQNYEMKYKKIIDKNEHNSKKHTGRFDDNISHKFLPQIQTRLDNDLVKKSLDEFKMVRRKTHYTLPPIDFKDKDLILDTDRYQNLVSNHDYNDKAERTNAKYNADSEYHTEDNQNNAYETYDERIYQSYEEDMPHYKQLSNLLARQKEIVRQLAQIHLIGRNNDVAFYDLMDEVKAKQEDYKKWKNYTKFSFDKLTTKTTTKLTTTAKPTTVVTLFDETEIRQALKNDPQIKRILKLANLKRKKYLDNVKNYLVNNNYVHDKEYAKKLSELPTDVNRGKSAESMNLNNKI